MNAQNEIAHSIGLYGCKNLPFLESGKGGRLQSHARIISQLITSAGFSVFGSHPQHYSERDTDGYTLMVAIGQSAINIHTYPERGTVTAWIITCPGEDDDGTATRKLATTLKLHFAATHMIAEDRGKLPLTRTVLRAV